MKATFTFSESHLSVMELVKSAIKKQKAEREETRKKTLRQVEEALDELAEHHSFRKAYIFGSVVRPYQFTASSDVDVAIPGITESERLHIVAGLSRNLERPVNVVRPEEVHFSNKIIEKGKKWKTS